MTFKQPSLPSHLPDSDEGDSGLTIIGIGASAGGLEALERLLRSMPEDSGYAFVVVQHLSADHPSLLSEILGRAINMDVVDVTDRLPVLPNTVYVSPPGHDVSLKQTVLRLTPLQPAAGPRISVDHFFTSLAEQRGKLAIGIVLSGTGTDGTLGCRAILDHGGITLVQSPEDATYSGMPDSAIHAGNASHVVAVPEMAQLLMQAQQAPQRSNAFNAILLQLRQTIGHDFTLYKKSTILRRIERRMQLRHVSSQAAYAELLKHDTSEVELLFSELLINVTQFFRDPEAFAVLKEEILRPLLIAKPSGSVFRVWVAGCASGEEAYSIAIVLHELKEQHNLKLTLQFFATDLDDDAIATARAGVYSMAIAQDVSAQRLERYFTLAEGGYRVRKEIREMVVFAVQNVIKDPPFTRLDLLCCRNLLIYLGPALQSRLFPTFHYALKSDGLLFLSPSESIGSHTALFTPRHRKWKFYTANKTPSSRAATLNSSLAWVSAQVTKQPDQPVKTRKEVNLMELTRRVLLQEFVPASVVTDLVGNILYVHGDTGNYLRPAPGQATLNVIEMAREGLQLELRAAVQQAASNGPATHGLAVVLTGQGQPLSVHLTVRRLNDSEQGERLLLVSFQEQSDFLRVESAAEAPTVAASTSKQIKVLERDLAYTRENLQATIDELQSANEELSTSNEEAQSTNEELQSSNEELETSREELQSVNEELVTVNAELQAKIEQLGDMQNDMKNLLDSISIGTIFLDTKLAIRRFTRDAVKIFRLIPKDVGRPLGDISSYLDNADLLARAQEVLDTLIPYEVELRTTSGNWFLARLLPYRTLDNVIDGVVLTFHDINTRVANEQAVQLARELAEAIVDTIVEPLLVLDENLCVVTTSRSYCRDFLTTTGETNGRQLYELGNRQWDIPQLRDCLSKLLRGDINFEGLLIEQDFPGIGALTLSLNARRVTANSTSEHLILLAMQHHSLRR